MESGVITALEVQKRNKERVNVYVDGVYAFSLTLTEAARLHKGQRLSPADVEALCTEDNVQKAVDRAARLLASRPRSEKEVRDNLAQKKTPPAVIDTAIERLNALGYLDDVAFARYWVQGRSESRKPLGEKGLRYELRQKGIADAIIAEVLAEVDDDEVAYRAASGQASRLRSGNRRDFRNKLGSYLQRRGFNYATAHRAIERLLEELQENDPDFFSAAENEDVEEA